ncbi:hypothetical protein C8F01DRAFT_1158959 [Mycena amicta]|nr:hypothetical protein C8F01DRAFT_1158959 [Mycena amicta]
MSFPPPPSRAAPTSTSAILNEATLYRPGWKIPSVRALTRVGACLGHPHRLPVVSCIWHPHASLRLVNIFFPCRSHCLYWCSFSSGLRLWLAAVLSESLVILFLALSLWNLIGFVRSASPRCSLKHQVILSRMSCSFLSVTRTTNILSSARW